MVPGLWLVALDSCRWKENEPHEESVVGGSFSAETLAWLEDALIASKKENKAVMAAIHHGIWEHYTGKAKYYAKYLVDDHKRIAGIFIFRFITTFPFSIWNYALQIEEFCKLNIEKKSPTPSGSSICRAALRRNRIFLQAHSCFPPYLPGAGCL